MAILKENQSELERYKDEVAYSLRRLLDLDPKQMYQLSQAKPPEESKDKGKELVFWAVYLGLVRYSLDNINKPARR